MPVATVKVTGASGSETIELRKNKADYYAKPSIGGGVYKVSPDDQRGHRQGARRLPATRNSSISA